MYILDGHDLVHSTNFYVERKERRRNKPSTHRDSNPLPLEFLLLRRALYPCALSCMKLKIPRAGIQTRTIRFIHRSRTLSQGQLQKKNRH